MDIETVIETCARAAHEANRAYCIALGDMSQPPWEDAPTWQRESARNGVKPALAGATPQQSHESWMAEKRATGWTYGPVKDPEKRTHPCMLPYSQLPPAQRMKDSIYLSVVRSVGSGIGAAIYMTSPFQEKPSQRMAVISDEHVTALRTLISEVCEHYPVAITARAMLNDEATMQQLREIVTEIQSDERPAPRTDLIPNRLFTAVTYVQQLIELRALITG